MRSKITILTANRQTQSDAQRKLSYPHNNRKVMNLELN